MTMIFHMTKKETKKKFKNLKTKTLKELIDEGIIKESEIYSDYNHLQIKEKHNKK